VPAKAFLLLRCVLQLGQVGLQQGAGVEGGCGRELDQVFHGFQIGVEGGEAVGGNQSAALAASKGNAEAVELIHIIDVLPHAGKPRGGVGGDDAAQPVHLVDGGGGGAVHALADLPLHPALIARATNHKKAQYRR